MKNRKQKNSKEKRNSVENIAKTLPKQGKKNIYSDVDGSYTGTAMNSERPIQDADDL